MFLVIAAGAVKSLRSSITTPSSRLILSTVSSHESSGHAGWVLATIQVVCPQPSDSDIATCFVLQVKIYPDSFDYSAEP